MLNCRLVVDVGSDFDSLNFAPFRLPYQNGSANVVYDELGRELEHFLEPGSV